MFDVGRSSFLYFKPKTKDLTMPTTILLVDDHPLFRKGLRLLLEAQEDFRIVGEAGDGREAIDRVRTLSPDVVIMDITMPGFNGIDATRQIVSEVPSAKVVALSIHEGSQFVEDMLQAGAVGYILKDSVPEDLVNGIRSVIQGEVYLSPAITGIVVSEYKELLAKSLSTAQMKDASPILRTKLHRPTLSPDLVPRSDLVARLDELRRRPLTLVSSAAGYGKSTMASLWLEAWDGPYAWLSLDEEENDLRKFINYLLAAIGNAFPGACDTTRSLLQAPELAPVSVLSRHLVNDLDKIEDPFILVLDDFHKIREKTVHDLMSAFLTHPPQNPHLMLLTRRDPPLLARALRGRGQVNEIAAAELQFTAAETALFLKNTRGLSIDGKTAATIQEKLEGWPAGMRLMSQSLKYSGDLDRLLAGLKGGFAAIVDYLVTEVLSHQPPEMTRLMTATAILDRFCVPLCEVLGGADAEPGKGGIDGAAFIAKLQNDNLFLIVLDPEKRWFRYHHLFQKLLVNQLNRQYSAEEINALHTRASIWFAENGLIEEALQHALAGDDIPAAMQLVARHGHQLMNDQQWPRLERWLDMLPRDRVEQDPELLLLEAWIYHIRHQLLEMAACLDKVETLIATSLPGASAGAEHIRGHFEALRGFQSCIAVDSERALIQTRYACENIPREHKRALAFAHLFLAGAYQMAGDLETGLSSLHKAASDNILQGDPYRAHYLVNPCFLYWMAADLTAMWQAADRSLKIDKDHQLPETVVYGLYFLGIAHYHRNELQIAEEKLVAAVKDNYAYNGVNFAHSSFALALTYQARGLPGKAGEVSESVVSFALDTNNTTMLKIAQAFQAELALRQGHLAEASHWAEQFVAKPFLLAYRFYMPQLTLVKILLAQDTAVSREHAGDLLKQLYDFVVSTHNTRFQIEVLALQALLCDIRGEGPAALESLAKALDLAEPGGFIRLFVDLGPRMADLLKRLQKQNVAVDYIEKLLAAFGDDEQVIVSEAADHPTPSQPLVEPLTNREIDVLELLAQRLQNKEIADKLFVSPETVKGHLKIIYQKLDVGSRREAVEKAKKIGIL